LKRFVKMSREKYLLDPERLPKEERLYYAKIKLVIEGLLDGLKKKGYFRRTTRVEMRYFVDLMRDEDEIAMLLNRPSEAFKNAGNQ